MGTQRRSRPPATRVLGVLGGAPLVVLFLGLLGLVAFPGTAQEMISVFTAGAFLTILEMRLVVASVIWPERRTAFFALVAGILLWLLGSLSLNAAGTANLTRFPAPGEWFFLSAYIGIAGYLLLDCARDARASISVWLESAVACGGAACIAGLLMVTPLADDFGRQGVPLLVALLFPLFDVILLIVLIGQVLLRLRGITVATAVTGLGVLLLVAADTSLVVNLAAGTYRYGVLLEVMWGTGFYLIVFGACRPRWSGRSATGYSQFRGVGVMAASAVALVVLTFPPPEPAKPYVLVPACLTLVFAGLRMVVALRQAQEAAEAYRLSRTDDLTGLPNRRAVMAELNRHLATDRPVALMLLDLDGFKEINDSLGHASGDILLTTVGKRIRDTQPDRVLVARLGGDEFALVLVEDGETLLTELAHRIRDVVHVPVAIDGLEVSMTVSVGIAIRRGPTTQGSDLLRQADVAMYQAKAKRVGVLFYDSSRDTFSRHRLSIAEDLRNGIDSGELAIWYQPQVKAGDGETCALEALVRWAHPRHGLLSPADFLPAARRAGLMPSLTEVVTELVVADIRDWLMEGMRFRVAINIAPPELLSAAVLNRLFAQVDSVGLPPQSLVVEVTEESFIADPEHARKVLEQILSHDIQVSIDDYGTGFSSLSYLRDLPVQELKIDRSFVGAILSDARSRFIVSATNDMAHGLGLRTVAEGVEDVATSDELTAMGIDVLQGFHFARPMPTAEVAPWVAGRSRVRLPVR